MGPGQRRVSEPQDDLPDLLGARPNVQAPEDGSFVRVEVNAKESFPLTVISARYVSEVELVLRADGTDYPLSGRGGIVLDPAGTNPRSEDRWVAVQGHPEDLSVVVRLDGEEQVVDASDGSVDPGRFVDLAGLPTIQEQFQNRTSFSCGRFTRLDDSPITLPYPQYVDCRVAQVMRTPYVDGLGWAEPGREFLAVQIERPNQIDVTVDDGAPTDTYYSSTLAISGKLNGRPSLAAPAGMKALGQYVLGPEGTQLVFDVAKDRPAGDLTVTTRIRARGQIGFTIRTERAAIRWTVPGRKLA